MRVLTGVRESARWSAGLAAVALLAACQGAPDIAQPTAVPPTQAPTPQIPPGCTDYVQFTDAPGTTVTILTALDADERQLLSQAWSEFESCTGIRITFEVAEDLNEALSDRLGSEASPDLVFLPSPHLVPGLVERDLLIPAPAQTVAHVNQLWQPVWADYGSHEQTLFAAPLSAHVGSLVWYSPKQFAAWQIDVPTTWDEMFDLSDRLAESGVKPWCGGIAVGDESGAPAAAWLSEIMLRLYGGVVYDRWITNELEFFSPQVIGAMQVLEYWLRNPQFVNGGFGDPESIATTPEQSVGRAILDGQCALWQQGSEQVSIWPFLNPDVEISSAGDVFAFALPALGDAVENPVVGSGQFVAALADREEISHVRNYLSSSKFAAARAALGGWITANSQVPSATYPNPIDELAAQMLTRPDSVFRIEGAELMPDVVGRNAFPTQMTQWFAGIQGTEEVLSAIDAAWPQS